MLHRSEWLQHAQRLAVGQSTRVRHNCGRNAVMAVYNNEQEWSCWCFRCKEGGRVQKEHQRLRSAVQEPDRVSPIPVDALHLQDIMDFEKRAVWALLAEKGCPPGVIPEEEIWYARSVRRIVLKRTTVALGRALDPNRTPKWLPYGAWHGHPMIWQTRGAAVGTEHVAGAKPGLILTEDALSAYKVAKAINTCAPSSSVCVVATLGTRITDRFLPHCTGRQVLCMYDGDAAGATGFTDMRQRLAVWGQPVLDLRPTSGDPKDKTLEEIWQSIKTDI